MFLFSVLPSVLHSRELNINNDNIIAIFTGNSDFNHLFHFISCKLYQQLLLQLQSLILHENNFILNTLSVAQSWRVPGSIKCFYDDVTITYQ